MDANVLPMRWIRTLVVTGSLTLLVAALYFARTILIPVVLAVLLTFVLSPLVTWLQRRHVRRWIAVFLVVILALGLVISFGTAVFAQMESLGVDLPQHKQTIAQKIDTMRSWLDSVYQPFHEINQATKEAKHSSLTQTQEPVPVTIVENNQLAFLPAIAPTVLEFLVQSLLVCILVVFMLISREDLRNRVIRLSGESSITSMTKALDDAARRISRYLLMQLGINSGFGLAVSIGLYFIGVPYPLLWGVLSGAFRYLPYIGPWIGCAFPLALSLAVFPGWTETLLIFGLYVVLENITGNILEPMLFGQSIGVSAVALLIAAAFWAWLWGPVGLLMSAPLTACLVVMGRYIPQLEFFDVLLGDEPVLPIEVTYYQRLLARDEDEAAQLAEDFATKNGVQAVYDKVFLPALILAADNHERDRLSNEDLTYIREITSQLIEEIPAPEPRAGTTESHDAAPAAEEERLAPVKLLGCPARDEADELVLQMLAQMLGEQRCIVEVVSAKTLLAEVVHRVEMEKTPMVCIASLPPRGLTHTRYLCKRLRSRFPTLKIVVVFPGRQGQDRIADRLKEAGANEIGRSLEECRDLLVPLVQVLTNSEEQRERWSEVALSH